MSVNILLIGYGKMGKTIERIAIERGNHIVGRIGRDNEADLNHFSNNDVDVAIEFTQPESAFQNVYTCIENGIPVVCGTTGWLEKKQEIEALCTSKKGGFFYASNFSIGVNLFFKLNEMLAVIMNRFPDYEPAMEEIHHIHKKDAPSGTAITLAEGLMKHNQQKKHWTLEESTLVDGELFIRAIREGEVPGTHTVSYTSQIDSIEIKHTAFNREGFATGAVLAAEFLAGKEGIFGMNDLLKIN